MKYGYEIVWIVLNLSGFSLLECCQQEVGNNGKLNHMKFKINQYKID